MYIYKWKDDMIYISLVYLKQNYTIVICEYTFFQQLMRPLHPYYTRILSLVYPFLEILQKTDIIFVLVHFGIQSIRLLDWTFEVILLFS